MRNGVMVYGSKMRWRHGQTARRNLTIRDQVATCFFEHTVQINSTAFFVNKYCLYVSAEFHRCDPSATSPSRAIYIGMPMRSSS